MYNGSSVHADKNGLPSIFALRRLGKRCRQRGSADRRRNFNFQSGPMGRFDRREQENDGRFFEKVEKEFQVIRGDIKGILAKLPPEPITRGSPLHLTEMGERISHDLSAKEWATEHAHELRDKVEGKPPYETRNSALIMSKRNLLRTRSWSRRSACALTKTGLTRTEC